MPPRPRIRVALALLAISLPVWLVAQWWFSSPSFTAEELNRAMSMGDYPSVLTMCDQLLEQTPTDGELLLIAGQSAEQFGQPDRALTYYQRLIAQPAANPADLVQAHGRSGESHVQLRQMSAAIEQLTACVQLDNTQSEARQRLVYLLNLSGQRWLAAFHLMELVKQRQAGVQELLYLGNIAKSIENEAELQQYLQATPGDALPKLGLARLRLRAADLQGSHDLLQQVLKQSPDLVEAHVQLGLVWLQLDPEKIRTWQATLPSAAQAHPDAWLIRGLWAKDQGQMSSAVRCFGEALRLDPDHLAAIKAIAQGLHATGDTARAGMWSQRSEILDQFLSVLERIMADEWSIRQQLAAQQLSPQQAAQYLRSTERLEPIIRAAELSFELGRTIESRAWLEYGLSADPNQPRLKTLTAQLDQSSRQPMNKSDTMHAVHRLARSTGVLIDPDWLANMDLPNFAATASTAATTSTRSSNSAASDKQSDGPAADKKSTLIRFRELSPTTPATNNKSTHEAARGLFDFVHFSSRTSHSDGRRMFEFTGSGAGVLDYDHDGWPDVFLVQGSHWPPDQTPPAQAQPIYSDQLYRNQVHETATRPLVNITERARIVESAFGQGVAIGDLDSDGFDDIYVANIGLNQLWLNQGDGTFRDATWLLENQQPSWTASAAMADLDGDGQNEIYDANYAQGDDVFDRRCLLGNLPRACAPLNFDPAPDRLWALNDQGRLTDVLPQSIDAPIRHGYALGLSIFRISDQKLPSIFVANDQVANWLLTSQLDQQPPQKIRWEETAALTGLAFDKDGRAQACMGVACEDFNSDGRMDLVVTNFYDESNTLYQQIDGGMFRDATGGSGLTAPSLKMLGFGVQAIDAANTGALDLVVLNGHIDDMTHINNTPFAMRAQLLAGDGQGRFTELSASQVGDYFAVPRVGRALTKIDIDADGREDLIATELDGPARLLHNQSTAGSFLQLQLVGIQCNRDAIGTEVRLTINDRTLTKQLSAGSGYMASNERRLHFGCGPATQVDRLEVHWPSGLKQSFSSIATGQRYLLVEGGQLSTSPRPLRD